MIRVARWILAAIVLFVGIAFCLAGAQERVIKLPEDGSKWYVSVVGVGEDARYQEVLGWFNTHEKLSALRSATHFCPITTKSPLYRERYAPNCKSLPTVRVQDSKGVVIYESAGRRIPMTAGGLYSAIAAASDGHELLPWRRRHSQPQPAPVNPAPAPNNDPAPEPIDDSGPPTLDNVYELGGGLLVLCGLALLAGGVWSAVERANSRWK
jgi:hypothetical protein